MTLQATLCETAYKEHKNSSTGKMVEYSTIPDMLIDDIIPKYFLNEKDSFGEIEAENIRAVNELYSKGHVPMNRDKVWTSDNEEKEQKADERIKEAVKTFLQPSFNMMKNND